MQSDDVIWQVINGGFCSFKIKTETSTFCRNENNVTGQCNKISCPLANSRYATVREINGECFLYHKVIERSHLPSKMWEKIRLRGSVEQVAAKIEKHLEYMPAFYKAKCKDRYIRIQEYLRRTERLKNDPNQPILTVRKMKVVRREAKNEVRAMKVAQIENAIERELVERLQKGVYGDIYNLPQQTFEKVLEKHGTPQEMEEESEVEVEYVEGDEEEYEEEDEEEEEYEVEYENDFVPSESELVDDLEDIIKEPPRKKKAVVEIEYEDEGPSKQLA